MLYTNPLFKGLVCYSMREKKIARQPYCRKAFRIYNFFKVYHFFFKVYQLSKILYYDNKTKEKPA